MSTKVVILSCFDTYGNRVDLLYEFFKTKGYDTHVLVSSFSHFFKKGIEYKKEGYTYLPTRAYSNNISIKRLFSHFMFAQVANREIKKIQPDILYILCPPNLLASVGRKYKINHKQCTLILDIIDLWPETLPVKLWKDKFPFTIWKNIRTKSLDYADAVITECNLYQEVLKKNNLMRNIKTLYLARMDSEEKIEPILSHKEVHFCYLGSINNIIDIDAIAVLVKSVIKIKPVVVHIIGDGEKREEFISALKSAGAKVAYYGKVFDERKKHEIFAKCHFGLNIMKDTVCVGLTIKSIDYFEAGLPIINTIKGDTWDLVITEEIGFNLCIDEVEQTSAVICLLGQKNNFYMRRRSRDLFYKLFSDKAFMKTLAQLLDATIEISY